MTGKMLTVNWEARVGFECHFIHKDARVALNEARVNGRVTPDQWRRATDVLGDLFEDRNVPREDEVFLMGIIGGRTDLLPTVGSDNPYLYREQLDPGTVTELAVTEPV